MGTLCDDVTKMNEGIFLLVVGNSIQEIAGED